MTKLKDAIYKELSTIVVGCDISGKSADRLFILIDQLYTRIDSLGETIVELLDAEVEV